MATFLFDRIIFGPVISRRLGVSLGINLLPANSKICSFDCIYCECGRNPENRDREIHLPSRKEVKEKLEQTLQMMQSENRLPDVITFAGNGEPTLHPRFPEIVGDTAVLRSLYAPEARIAVLSNATRIHRPAVFSALLQVDDNIQKLDSAIPATLRLLNCPPGGFSLHKTTEHLRAFNGKVIIQTLFVKGSFKGETIDNSTPGEIEPWIELLKIIKPSRVMIYTIARDTPVETLVKIPSGKLREIALRVEAEGLKVQVSG